MKKIGAGYYVTDDGRYVIASDSPSMGDAEFNGRIDYEVPRATEWFVYDATSPRVARGDFGPPDAIADGFTTRREALAFVERQS